MSKEVNYRIATVVHMLLLFIYVAHVIEEISVRFFLAVIFGIWFPIIAGAGFILIAGMIPWLLKGAKWSLYGSLFFALAMIGHAVVHIVILIYLHDALGAETGIGTLVIAVPYLIFLFQLIYKTKSG